MWDSLIDLVPDLSRGLVSRGLNSALKMKQTNSKFCKQALSVYAIKTDRKAQ